MAVFRQTRLKHFLQIGKVMARIFSDSKRIFLIDYLAIDQTINRTYYATLLNKDKVAINISKRKTHDGSKDCAIQSCKWVVIHRSNFSNKKRMNYDSRRD